MKGKEMIKNYAMGGQISGLTPSQLDLAWNTMGRVAANADELVIHIGARPGGDSQLFRMMSSFNNVRAVIYPSNKEEKERIFGSVSRSLNPGLQVRMWNGIQRPVAVAQAADAAVVAVSEMVMPSNPPDEWILIRAIRDMRKPLVIMFPDGTFRNEA